MSTASSKPFEITEDDIGVEGKYLYRGQPATLVAVLDRSSREGCRAVFKTVCSDGEEAIGVSRLDGSSPFSDPGREAYITRIRPKVYVGVKLSGRLSTSDIGRRIPDVLRSFVSKTPREAKAGVSSWGGDAGHVHVFEIEVED